MPQRCAVAAPQLSVLSVGIFQAPRLNADILNTDYGFRNHFKEIGCRIGTLVIFVAFRGTTVAGYPPAPLS